MKKGKIMTYIQFVPHSNQMKDFRIEGACYLVSVNPYIEVWKRRGTSPQIFQFDMVNIYVWMMGKMIAKPSQMVFETWQLPMERDQGCKSERLLFETIRLHALPCTLHCVTTALLLVGESLTRCTSTASFTVLCFQFLIFMLLLTHLLFAKLQQQMSVLLSFMADSCRRSN